MGLYPRSRERYIPDESTQDFCVPIFMNREGLSLEESGMLKKGSQAWVFCCQPFFSSKITQHGLRKSVLYAKYMCHYFYISCRIFQEVGVICYNSVIFLELIGFPSVFFALSGFCSTRLFLFGLFALTGFPPQSFLAVNLSSKATNRGEQRVSAAPTQARLSIWSNIPAMLSGRIRRCSIAVTRIRIRPDVIIVCIEPS